MGHPEYSLNFISPILMFYYISRLFSGVSLLGVLLVFFLLPETKGKSLSEIEEIFGDSPNYCNQKSYEQPKNTSTIL